MACERQLDFYLPVPVMDVFNYVASQNEIYKMKMAAVDRANFKIFLKHRANMLTWGEHITISFYEPLDGGCRIIVESKPALATTLIDYGKNAENCNYVRQFILSSFNQPLNGQVR